jgi:hypothetical protein
MRPRSEALIQTIGRNKRSALKAGVFVAAFILLASSGPAQLAGKPRFEFKGLQFGDSMPASKGFLRGNGLACNADKVVPGAQYCDEVFGFKVAGISISSPLRDYLDGRLYSLYMTFNADDYNGVIEALEAKYGPADSTTTEEIQNRMGAGFTNRTKRWFFADGYLEAEHYGSRVTEGNIYAVGARGLSEYEARRKAAAAKAAAADLGPPVKH